MTRNSAVSYNTIKLLVFCHITGMPDKDEASFYNPLLDSKLPGNEVLTHWFKF